MKLIDKDALVTEIEASIKGIEVSQKAGLIKKRDADKKIFLFKSVLSLIDTIEVKEIGVDLGDPKGDKSYTYVLDTETLAVKEVDLKEEIGSYIETSLTGTNPIYTKGGVSCIIDKTAKHFFELGISVSNKAQKGE